MYYLNSGLLPLIPVVAIAALLAVFVNFRRRLKVQRAFGEWKLLAKVSKPLSTGRYIARGLLAAATASLIVFALARPVVQNGTKSIAQGTVDVIAVVDVSRSMAALDYEGKVPLSAVPTRVIEPSQDQPKRKWPEEVPGSRLEMVRHIMQNNMVKALDGNQLGIVSYAGEAFPQAFLTRDANALNWVIDRGLTVSSAPGEGSNMAKALELALAMFDADSPANHEKVIVLFSDGGNDSEPEALAEMARECKSRQVTLIVVALGNVMPSKIPVAKLAFDDDVAEALWSNGKRWYEVEGEVIKTGMNVPVLQRIAAQGGGEFIHLTNSSDIDLMKHLGKTSLTTVPGSLELFPWALVGAFISLILTVAVTNQWRRRKQS